MASEQGIVVRTGKNNTAWVKTARTSACESCSAKASCNTLDGGGGKDIEVEALNPINAEIGDQVVIGFESASLYKATFLIYIFPILCMLIGAFTGHELAASIALDPSPASAIFGFLFLGLAFIFIKFKANKLSQKDAYRPTIVRVIHK